MSNLAATKKLNKEQLEAVRHKEGPLLIIAGAGTGKTTVVTSRIEYLISKGLVEPSEILALTFTEKAAREMQERIDIALPFGYIQMWISTFHGFCDRILRDEALHIGLDPKFKLMSEAETVQLVRQNLFKFELKYFRPLGNPTKFVGGMVRHFSRLKDEDVTPQEYIKWVKQKRTKKKKQNKEESLEIEKWEELAEAYRIYEELKVGAGVMDFGDLITKTLKLFRERRNVLKEYKDRFKYILVDEFQDVNYAQNSLALELSGKKGNITVCGDDDQSIYRFRGAAVSNIIQFKRIYKKTKIVVLAKNYRSRQYILDASHNVIKNNNPDRLEFTEGINKKLLSSVKSNSGEITFFHESRVENEADRVAMEIKKITDVNQEVSYKFCDIAILVRANNHAEVFIKALQRLSLPYQFLGPGKLFRQEEIVDLISYLKVLNNFEDSVSFYRVLSHEIFAINHMAIARIGYFAKRKNISLFDACLLALKDPGRIKIGKKTALKIKKLLSFIKSQLGSLNDESVGQLLYNFLEKSGILKQLIDPDSIDAQKKAQNISSFFDKLKSYETEKQEVTVEAVVDWIELSMELGESPLVSNEDWTQNNAVNILTVHSSKGLEFPIVFLVNLVSARFPSINRREQIPLPEEIIKEILPKGDFHLQEERRLFYVGMTRAEELLYFSAADYYGERKREKSLSPFIFEALGKGASAAEKSKDIKQLSFLDFSENTVKKEKKIFNFHVDYLSYSQIQTFDICPLRYRLKYILKIPVPATAALSFGTSVHGAMKEFYKKVKMGEKPNEKLILSSLRNSWVNEGYKNKEHEKKMQERGEKYLTYFLENNFDQKCLPELLEENFVSSLFQPGERPLKIGGKMDRVDARSDGSLEIVDYKTSEKISSQREADRDLQLTFYALAAANITQKPFGVPIDKISLLLHFFEGGVKIETKRTAKDLKEAQKLIFKKRKEIEKSDFACSKNYLCKFCEYKLLCKSE